MKGYVKTKQVARWLSADDIGLTVRVGGGEKFELGFISASKDAVGLFGAWNPIIARHRLPHDGVVTVWMPDAEKGA